MRQLGIVIKPDFKQNLKSKTERLNKLDKLLITSPIKEFVKEHKHIAKEIFYRSSVQLTQTIQETNNCTRCTELSECPNLIQGHFTGIYEEFGYLEFRAKACYRLTEKQSLIQKQRLIKSNYIPREVTESTFESLDCDGKRAPIIESAIDFCTVFNNRIPVKGLYIYGPLGTGKSRIAGAIAQDIVRYGIDSYMIYVPEFMREIKKSIQDGTVENKIEELKTSTVVIFDDIGAEMVTPWARDEVLGAILQHRINEGLPTVFTSNFALDELEDHLSYAQKSGIEKLKAKRIMERIRHFVVPLHVEGNNRRL